MSDITALVMAHWSFVLITLLGSAAAYASGKAIAQTWRPYWHLPVYMLGMAAVTRFCHFALFEEPLLQLQGYVIDLAVLTLAASFGFRRLRVAQMLTQYGWLYESSGPLGWRRKG